MCTQEVIVADILVTRHMENLVDNTGTNIMGNGTSCITLESDKTGKVSPKVLQWPDFGGMVFRNHFYLSLVRDHLTFKTNLGDGPLRKIPLYNVEVYGYILL